MKKATLIVLFATLDAITFTCSINSAEWNQFRGPNATGLATTNDALPDELSFDKNLVWRTPIAKGHSSPVVDSDHIYVTTVREKRLLTITLNRDNGKLIWEREAPYDELESIHRIGSHATSSVVTDGERVVSFFGSCGMFCYDRDGKELWQLPMGPFNNQFGACSSPLIVDDRVISVQDHDTGSYLATFDKQTGKEVWRVERPVFRRNYGTPVIWNVDGQRQIVVAGTAHVVAYDFDTGERIWTVHGLCRVISNTPVVGNDGRLYVASDGGGNASPQPSFEDLIESGDANKNGLLEPSELPNSPIKGFFGQFDKDADGSFDRDEYESIREIFALAQSVAIAIRPGGTGDITDTHIDWTFKKSIPRNSSPLVANGHLFMVKDGGIMTSIDLKTGAAVRSARLAATGKYFSSPVHGDGKIYVLSETGTMNVVDAQGEWKVISDLDFKEDVYATPAIADGRIYVRTVENLYCFGR